MFVDEPWKCSHGKLRIERSGKDAVEQEFTLTNDELYAAEADAVAAYLEAKECPHMTKADTMGNMRALDGLRASAGFKFANETQP
jgi:hypothetical protein